MPAPYRTPGVHVEEIATLPPSVAEVATAVPAFVGFTELGPKDGAEPVVRRFATLLEFETEFGRAQPVDFKVTQPVDNDHPAGETLVVLPSGTGVKAFSLYYALSHYFKNGGGPCYVASVGTYGTTASDLKAPLLKGVQALEKEDEPTLIVLTDAACLLPPKSYYELCTEALAQCRKLGDRFTIIDVVKGDSETTFRDGMKSDYLMYGAAYHPYLTTSIPYAYDEKRVKVRRTTSASATVTGSVTLGEKGIVVRYSGPPAATGVTVKAGDKTVDFDIAGGTLSITDVTGDKGVDVVTAWNDWKKSKGGAAAEPFEIVPAGDGSGAVSTGARKVLTETPKEAEEVLEDLKDDATAVYSRVRAALDEQCVVLPPSAAVAGIYARVDRDVGVWKAPANVTVAAVLGPVVKITDQQQETLNVDPGAGKSINAIRDFTGKGTLVWGARTLAGNDNEWRYVPVRRLFITIEESAKKASAFAVFEPNDQATWLKVKAMIESYLYGLWERGALAGPKPETAYYVQVGLGTTMTPQDVLEGRMIVKIGVAAVRPAEFIVLKFSHKLQTA
jgi:phage tail sheath protein FI